LFLLAYMAGLLTAKTPPDIEQMRRELVDTITFMAYIVILLVIPSRASGLHKNLLTIIFSLSVLSAGYLLVDYIQQGGTYLDATSDVFDQVNRRAALISSGILILILLNKDFLTGPRRAIAALFLLFAALLSSSFLTLFQILLYLLVYLFDRVRSIGARIALVIFLGITAWVYIATVPSSGNHSKNIVNYRLTGLIGFFQTGDTTQLENVSTFQGRWASTVAGFSEIPKVIFQGRGLNQRDLWVEYVKAGKVRAGEATPHNSIIVIWLKAGSIAALPYLAFLWYFTKYFRQQLTRIHKENWRNPLTAVFVISIFSVTGAIDHTVLPLMLVLICVTKIYSEPDDIPSL